MSRYAVKGFEMARSQRVAPRRRSHSFRGSKYVDTCQSADYHRELVAATRPSITFVNKSLAVVFFIPPNYCQRTTDAARVFIDRPVDRQQQTSLRRCRDLVQIA